MTLRYALELVLAAAAGLGLARYRLTWPDLAETLGHPTGFDLFEVGIDAFLAGVALVGGLGTVAERIGGRSPAPWGPGRWAWSLVASFLILTQLDTVLGAVASRLSPNFVYAQNTLLMDIIAGIRGGYGNFLLPSAAWFLLALGLTSLAARRGARSAPDARESCGRAFAVLVVATWLVLRALLLLGVRPQVMGGGL